MVKSNFERKDKDRYWTEPWITRALISVLRDLKLDDILQPWEPACGHGDIVRVLAQEGLYKTGICISDIDMSEYDGMYSLAGPGVERDFLTTQVALGDAIITNPPYNVAQEFISHALRLNVGLVAMLMRNEYDCAKSRNYLFADPRFALKIVLTSRPRWDNWWKKEKPDKSPRHNYSWFVWINDWQEPPTIRYAGK